MLPKGGRLSLQIDQHAHNIVSGGHDFRICLEPALGPNEVDKLFPKSTFDSSREFDSVRPKPELSGLPIPTVSSACYPMPSPVSFPVVPKAIPLP